MQAISTIRCPSCGSRPVVSVSKTISRISLSLSPPLSVYTPALPSDRQPLGTQESDDCAQSVQAQAPTQTGRHNKVGAPTFLTIRHLITQDRRQALFRYTGSSQHSLTLHQARCGND